MGSDKMVYLDYAAATPTDEEVLNEFVKATKKYYANPNSNHKLGMEAKDAIDRSTKEIAKNLNVSPEEIIYTSGASETNNLVIKGICERYKARGKHILISSLEHNSITAAATKMQEQGFDVELLPITKEGYIDLEILKNMLRDDTILVSICTVDSELGLKQPIEEIGKILKAYPNCYFHTDASQSIGNIKTDYQDVDLITITPRKFYGLNGIGILVKRKNVSLIPQINGGKSTTIYRSGTPCLADIIATSKALDIALKNEQSRYEYILKLNEMVRKTLEKYEHVQINSTKNSIPHTINFSLKKINSLKLQQKLEEHDIYVSTKTSCCPLNTPSKLVYALTKDKNLSSSSIRISFSYLTTQQEVEEFLKVFDTIYKEYEQNGEI